MSQSGVGVGVLSGVACCCLLLLGSLDGSLPAELGPVWWVVVLGSLDDISLGRAWVSMSGSAA